MAWFGFTVGFPFFFGAFARGLEDGEDVVVVPVAVGAGGALASDFGDGVGGTTLALAPLASVCLAV